MNLNTGHSIDKMSNQLKFIISSNIRTLPPPAGGRFPPAPPGPPPPFGGVLLSGHTCNYADGGGSADAGGSACGSEKFTSQKEEGAIGFYAVN